MSEYILSCESTIDLNYDFIKERNLEVIRYSYILDDEIYEDDMGTDDKKLLDFYKDLREGKLASTTQINELEYKEYFLSLLEKNDNVLHVGFSSGLTGSFQNAVKVANEINAEYEGKNVVVVDSLCASSGYGLLIDMAADNRDAGMSMKELQDWIIDNRLKIHHFVFTMDLSHLQRGGRISKTEAVIGGLLNITPIIYMNPEGKLKVFDKTRGKKKVIRRFISIMEEFADKGLDYNKKCFISHSNYLDYAKEFEKVIEENFVNLKNKIRIYNIGPVIGSHTGEGTIAVFFYGKERPNVDK